MGIRNTVIKHILSLQIGGWSDRSVEAQRARLEKASRYLKPPADINCRHVQVGKVPAEWIDAPATDRGIILYLHGGAYALGSIDVYREFIARLARATKMRCLVINYHLAPEHPFPAALEDATTTYRWLLARGFEPSRIIFAGDSAGGGLALSSLVALRDAGEPLPAGAVCLSPWTDLALSGRSIQTKANNDPILDPLSLQKYAGYYAGEDERTSPLISPLYADLEGLPALLIQVGAEEILLDDAVRFTEKARKAGVSVTLQIVDEMFHVFHLIRFLPETKRAVKNIAAFVSQTIPDQRQSG